MSTPRGHAPPPWLALRKAASPCFEWTGFAGAAPELGEGALEAGRVTALPGGGPGRALHHAPDRWLLALPAARSIAALERAAGAGAGVLTEVSGKWCRIAIAGAGQPGAPCAPLASGFAIEHVLGARDCAALWLFDCPVIVSREGPDVEIWLESSYEASFLSTLASLDVRTDDERDAR